MTLKCKNPVLLTFRICFRRSETVASIILLKLPNDGTKSSKRLLPDILKIDSLTDITGAAMILKNNSFFNT